MGRIQPIRGPVGKEAHRPYLDYRLAHSIWATNRPSFLVPVAALSLYLADDAIATKPSGSGEEGAVPLPFSGLSSSLPDRDLVRRGAGNPCDDPRAGPLLHRQGRDPGLD